MVDLLERSLSTSTRSSNVISFPSLLISLGEERRTKLATTGANSADVAVGFFEQMGFRAQRTRMNVHGYPGLLRELMAPPPWVEIELNDCEGAVPPSRARALQPLFQIAVDVPHSELLARYRQHLEERGPFMQNLLPSQIHETVTSTSMDMFEGLLGLARCIGGSSFEDVCAAVFAYDEFPLFPGAPDLLVWRPDSNDGLWFFAEVKAPGDTLRESQRDWLKLNWDRIRGRFVLAILE